MYLATCSRVLSKVQGASLNINLYLPKISMRRPNMAVNSAEIESKKAVNSCMQCSVKENNALCIVDCNVLVRESQSKSKWNI